MGSVKCNESKLKRFGLYSLQNGNIRLQQQGDIDTAMMGLTQIKMEITRCTASFAKTCRESSVEIYVTTMCVSLFRERLTHLTATRITFLSQ